MDMKLIKRRSTYFSHQNEHCGPTGILVVFIIFTNELKRGENEVIKFSDCSEPFLLEKAKSKGEELLCLVILSNMSGEEGWEGQG